MEETNETTNTVARGGREMRGPIAENSDSSDVTSPVEGGNGSGTPPTMPEMNCDEDESGETNCEMPEPPEGFSGEEGGEIPAEWRRDGEMPMLISEQGVSNSDSILHPVGYLALGGCSVILGIVISYACFSRCFHLKPGQTFSSLKKFIWFIVVAVVVAILLMVLCYFVPVWVSA